MVQYFEWNLPNDGNLWKQLKADAKHLQEAGVSAVWIPPAYKATQQADVGYGTYDLYDLGEFDQKGTVRTKYGTKQELKEMIDELHRHGIGVYLDAVMNHKAAADYTERFWVREVDPEERDEAVGEPFEIEGWTGFDFPGRGDRYSGFKWHWFHFSGTDYDTLTDRTGVFQILGEGKGWSQGVDRENGNYDYLMFADIDLDHPDVVEELEKWGVWVTNELDLDGMRLDAIKHMDDHFIKHFLETVRKERGRQFYAVGEYWKDDMESLGNYLERVDYEVNLFDVRLHYNFYEASQQGREYDLSALLQDTLVEACPDQTVTFVDNHDSQKNSSLESQVKSWFKPLAYGVILLMKKGYPCVFYGDYYSMNGQASPHRVILDILLDARRRYAYGEQLDYFDHPNTVGFVRTGDEDHPGSGLVLLLSNGEDGDKRMNVGTARQGETWHEITGCIPDEVTIDEKGNGDFRVPGGKLAVWVKKD